MTASKEIRATLYFSGIRRGLNPTLAVVVAAVIHPFEDTLEPSRRLEDLVRPRAEAVARSAGARSLGLRQEAESALVQYVAWAELCGDRRYQSAFEKALQMLRDAPHSVDVAPMPPRIAPAAFEIPAMLETPAGIIGMAAALVVVLLVLAVILV